MVILLTGAIIAGFVGGVIAVGLVLLADQVLG